MNNKNKEDSLFMNENTSFINNTENTHDINESAIANDIFENTKKTGEIIKIKAVHYISKIKEQNTKAYQYLSEKIIYLYKKIKGPFTNETVSNEIVEI